MDPVKIDDDIWAKLEEAMSQNNYIRFEYLNYEREFVVQPWQPYLQRRNVESVCIKSDAGYQESKIL